jgi:type I site-specific restriction endonuclease
LFDKAVTQYSYIDAVNGNILVPFVSEIISTEVLYEGIKGKKLNKSEKDQYGDKMLLPLKILNQGVLNLIKFS